jgi:hypothetical protein
MRIRLRRTTFLTKRAVEVMVQHLQVHGAEHVLGTAGHIGTCVLVQHNGAKMLLFDGDVWALVCKHQQEIIGAAWAESAP